jgi:hypothetical protein
VLRSGEEIRSAAIVVATEGPESGRLLGHPFARGSRGVTCFHFAAAEAPFVEPILVLDAALEGPVHNLAVMSNVASSYAPPGAVLISATILGVGAPGEPAPEAAVRRQMEIWFGPAAGDWRLLRIDRIAHAQPAQEPPALQPPSRPVRIQPGLYVCGDHLDNASINGAMTSGRRAAEAILADRGARAG